ncbi:LysR family transcriptional regulator [Agrococcus sp. SGAir0287]|uniref:LysR family transcriptional regulator n=1 Tax=Agrococcus sp. SGAir0287 TaxID=2070347 RepID=UPI0010CCD376|nr:LysR family transcriptional regulator [Agrococcus sp. SGAir0287]QCR18780.1 LysR family transcriptional regulator [Agrococcus sp. SGAir0287]
MTLDVHPQLLRALRTVLEAGSLTAASERLGFTQSALSKQIAALEAAAGAPLLVRRPRGVVPTEAGRRLARHAAAVLDRLEVAARELEVLDATVGGRVALGAFPAAAARLVPVALARLRHEHPAVDVELAIASTPVQLRRLRAGRLDLALVASGDDLPAWDDAGIDLEPLPVGRPVVAVAAEHRLAGAGRVGVDELRREPWIAGGGAPGAPQFGPWPTLPDPEVVATLEEWTARLGFVAAGLGVTTVPSLLIDALPPGVVAVAVDDPRLVPRSLLLASVGERSLPAAAVRDAVHVEASSIAARSGR